MSAPGTYTLYWAAFRDAEHSTAYEKLGPAKRRRQDRFDENDADTERLLEENHRLNSSFLNDKSSANN